MYLYQNIQNFWRNDDFLNMLTTRRRTHTNLNVPESIQIEEHDKIFTLSMTQLLLFFILSDFLYTKVLPFQWFVMPAKH